MVAISKPADEGKPEPGLGPLLDERLELPGWELVEQ